MSVEGFTREGVDALRAMLDHAERFLASRMEDPHEFALLARARAEVEKVAALTPADARDDVLDLRAGADAQYDPIVRFQTTASEARATVEWLRQVACCPTHKDLAADLADDIAGLLPPV